MIASALHALAALAALGSPSAADEPALGFVQEDGRWSVRVQGLSPADLARLAAAEDRERRALLQLHAEAAPGRFHAVAMLAVVSVDGALLHLRPRFPLRPGVVYRATFEPQRAALALETGPLADTFRVPAPPAPEPARVLAVHPSADRLPENLLRMYVRFSAPMSRGEAYERLRLLDDEGRAIEHPFLELGEELWDPSGTRFTLFFDPGRVKRGLEPHERFGSPLVAGRSYTLIVDRGWRDAAGNELAGEWHKRFHVGAPDYASPDPRRWEVVHPASGTRDPVCVLFDEALDHGLLERVLTVHRGGGEEALRLDGTVHVDRAERRFSFTPAEPWSAAPHVVRARTILEDPCGNSLERPFEVDVFERVERAASPPAIDLPFRPTT